MTLISIKNYSIEKGMAQITVYKNIAFYGITPVSFKKTGRRVAMLYDKLELEKYIVKRSSGRPKQEPKQENSFNALKLW